MESSEVGKWSSKNVYPGQEFVVCMDDGDNYRAVVMLSGGWTKGDDCSWIDQVPKRRSLKNNKHTRMVRGGGQFFAVALCRIPSLVEFVESKSDPADESRYTNWQPNFITGKCVVGFWRDHLAGMKTRVKELLDRRRETAQRETLARAAAATLIEMVAPSRAPQILRHSAKGYTGASEMRQQFGASYGDNEFRMTTDGMMRLASRIASSTTDGNSDLAVLVRQLQNENNELRQRTEAAEEKVNALRFILNQ